MTALAWSIAGFLLGALPFSVWLGHRFLGTDVRRYGDHNPGASNMFRAGGVRLGVAALLLDMLKGAAPVAVAHHVCGVDGWPLAAVILAPILGHAFSPFLRFRGGKAIATTFGAWTAVTVPFGPFVMSLTLLALHRLLRTPGWAVAGALTALLVLLLAARVGPPLLAAWAGTTAVLLWRQWGPCAGALVRRCRSRGER